MFDMLPKALLVVPIAIAIPLIISFVGGGWMAVKLSPSFTFDDIPDLTGKVAFVTGGNTGIGKVTVRELARKGATVFMTSRSEQKGLQAVKDIKEAIGRPVRIAVLPLELASLKSVRACAEKFLKEGLSIDMLIFNAGVMMSPFQLSEDGIESQFATNTLGHFQLLRLLTPALAPAARVVHTSSLAHTNTYPEGVRFEQLNSEKNYSRTAAYGQSKLGNILVSNEFARRMQEKGSAITSNALHPGVIASDLYRHVDQLPGKGGILADLFVRVREMGLALIGMNVDQGALNQLYVATSPKVKGVTGKYFNPVGRLAAPSPFASDPKLAADLWGFAEKIAEKH